MNAAAATDAAVREADRIDRLLAAVPIASLFLWALVAYAWQAWLMKSPIIFSDELELSELARSVAATGHPALRGETLWKPTLVPFLFAPAWLLHNTESAYQVAKFIGVLFMTAAIFPAYRLARMVVGRPAALFAAAATVAIPAFMYSSLMLEEPFAYFFSTLGLWLAVRALTLRTRRAWAAAVAAAVVAPLVRQELAMIPVVLVLAAAALSWQSGRVARLRGGWSRATTARAAVLLVGVVVVANQAISDVSHTWQLSTQYYKHRVFELGAWAGGAFTIGIGVLPVIVSLALLVRAPGERRSPALSAFRATLAGALVAFSLYASIKAAYLSTTLATRALERNLFYLAPLLFVATAIWLERPRLRLWALAASAGVVALLLWAVPIQLDWPYFEAPGFSLLALFNRDLYVAPATLQSLVLPLGAIGLALVVLPLALRRVPAARTAAVVLAAGLVVAWNGAGSWAAGSGERASARALMSNFPDPPNWVDQATGGAPTIYLGQTITDANGIWLNEFWNRSIRYVWSLDGTAPGPGPTLTPNILSPDGTTVQRGEVRYVLAGAGISVLGHVVASPAFGAAGRPLRLFRIDYPLRYTSTTTGFYSDGWSGTAPVAYNAFRTPGEQPERLTVSASRVGGGPPTTATIRLGRLVLDASTAPTMGQVLAVRHCRIPAGGTCRITFTTPPPPFRAEVTVAKPWSPHDADPRNSDRRELGAQVGFSASRR